MRLKIFSPIGTVLDTEISKIDFESINGFYTFLPKHVDCVSALADGIITYAHAGKPAYAACNHGVIVKKGGDVSISTGLAILGDNLRVLTEKIEIEFKKMEEERKEINTSIVKLEIGLQKGIMALHKEGEDHVGI